MTDKKGKREKTIKVTLSLDDEEESIKADVQTKKSAFLDDSVLISLANLEEQEGKRNAEYGEVSVRLLNFRDDSHREKIIALLRDNYSETLWALTPLIRNLGSSARASIRRKAAEAAGRLMREADFDRVKNEVIIPWAVSDNLAVNLNVGIALYEAAQDSRYAENVKSLLKHWVSLDNLNYAWTALLSCIPFCETWHEEILDMIERSFKHQRFELLALAFFVCRELQQKGHDDKLAARLVRWINSGKEKNHYRIAAGLIFMETVEFSTVAGKPSLAEDAVKIFKTGLEDRSIDNAGVHRELFLETLKDWLDGAQSGKPGMENAQKFFMKLYKASDETGKQRLEYHVRKWAHDKKASDVRIFKNLEQKLHPEQRSKS